MSEVTLQRKLAFLRAFDVRMDDDAIYVHDGHNGVICNPETEWQEFLDHSIREVACGVAEETGRKIKWME